jgi:hypothetical protein
MSTFRLITAALAVPAMKVTGFRFSKDYRWGVSTFHRAVYRCVNTVQANWWAGL